MKRQIGRRCGQIPAEDVMLTGDLTVPADPAGVVVFAHGSGSSRHSPRNRAVADRLNTAGLATLLMDLLTEEEEAVDVRTAELRFDLDLLAARVAAAVSWLDDDKELTALPVGLFGASTGAAAALVVAATFSAGRVGAVVSRGGRPDLAGEDLALVRCPTLLVVGERDERVLGWNRQALAAMSCPKRLEVVPGATHLFEEPGALEQVSTLASDWFCEHLSAGAGGRERSR